MGTPLRRAGHDRGARMVERAIVAVSVVGLLVMLATAPQWGAWVDNAGPAFVAGQCGE